MNTYTHSKNSNTIKSKEFIAISNSYEVALILDHDIMLITNTRRVLWWYQTSHHNRVTIKVDLGTLNVLVDLMDLEWDFSMLMKEKYSGPSQWNCIDTACKHVTGSQECHITKRVKSACRERDRTRYIWYQMIGSRTNNISWNKRNWVQC
jgi:hypothetical protein